MARMSVVETRRDPSTSMRLALALASAGTALIAAWLAFVLVAVLPSRSPASIPAWLAIDLLAVALVAIAAAWLASPGRRLAVALRIAGIAGAVVGGWLAATWLLTPPGQEGEGYVLLIGGWLLVHGVLAVAAPGSGIGLRRATRATPPG